MYIVFEEDGSVLSRFKRQVPNSEWFPDDTQLRQETPEGKPGATHKVRVSRRQEDDWPERAARRWTGTQWDSTGEPTKETDLEKMIRLLEANPVPELPDAPTVAQVIDQVKLHRRYIEGYRKILIRVLNRE